MKTVWTELKPFPRKAYNFLHDWYIKGRDQETGDLDTLKIIQAQLMDELDEARIYGAPAGFSLYADGIHTALSVVERNMKILELRENTVQLKEHKCSVCGHDEFIFVEHGTDSKKYDLVCPVCGEVFDTIEEKTL